MGFWWLVLHEFKKFQIFVIFALYKNQGCYRLPPLKEISSRDLGRLERKIGLGNWVYSRLGGLPPLKENFVGCLNSCPPGSWVYYIFIIHNYCRHVTFYGLMGPYSLPSGCVYPHRLECGLTQDGLSRTFPHGREIGRASCRERV